MVRIRPDPDLQHWCVLYHFYNYSWSGSETLLYSASTECWKEALVNFTFAAYVFAKYFFLNNSWPMFYRCEAWTESRHLHSQPERRTESQGRGQLCVPEVPGPGGRVRRLVHLCEKGRAQVSGTGPPGPGEDAHCQGQGCGSGSALIWVAGSGSGSRRAKMTKKYRKKSRILHVSKCLIFFFEDWRLLL